MDLGIYTGQEQYQKRPLGRLFLVILSICGVIALLIVWRVQTKYSSAINSVENAPQVETAVVFGAGLKAKGEPSSLLEKRILTAIKLYQLSKITKVVMSGDNSSINHNEVQAMKNFAMEQGLPEELILEDHAGLNTYDTCRNLKEQFGLNKMILVTQSQHLRRAIYVCRELGLEAYGVPAEGSFFAWRELAAAVSDFVKLLFK